MKRNFQIFITFLLTVNYAMAKDIYVAKTGNNTNAGTIASPYLTIQKAASVAVAGDVVIIKAGTYEETVTPSNSGTSEKPIIFKSATGEKVIISAMQAVSGWTLDKANVYKTAVDWDLGQENMVLHGNKLMDLARWPNNTSESPFPLTFNKMSSGGTDYIEYAAGIPAGNWSNGGSIHFYGGAGFLAWKEYITKIVGNKVYFNLQRNVSWIPDKHNPGYTGHGKYDGEFYLQGIKEALDYKNEWFYDKSAKILYVQIDGGGKPADGAIMMRKRTIAIELNKNYITFENLAVFGGAINISGSNNTLSQVSSFYGNYHMGVVSSFTSNAQSVLLLGNYNTITKCEIAYGAGSGLTDKGNNNKLINSYVHHFNFLGNYDCVLNTRGATNAVYKNNKLEYGGRDIIQAYADNSEYAYNEVAWSNIVADDCGLLYTTNVRATKSSIHHNWFHDAHAKTGRHKAAGIYLDNDSKNWDVYNNVVWNVDWSNIQINWNGINLNIYNNTFVKAGYSTMGAWHKEGTAFSNVNVWNNITDKEAINAGDQETEQTWEAQADKQNNLVDKTVFVDYNNNNFHLKAGSKAIDAGRVITGYTDGYSGAKPDVGAFEFGNNWVAGIDWDITNGPVGTGCYGLPGESCNTTAPIVDKVSFNKPTTSIIQALTFEVEVGYTAIQARDVFAIFSAPNGTWLGNGKVSVSAGTGVATVKVTVANLPAVANDYKITIAIRPVGSTSAADNIASSTALVDVIDKLSTSIIVVEAENFSSTSGLPNVDFDASGVGIGVKNDGAYISWVNKGDYADYSVFISEAGNYSITYLLSAPENGAQIQMILLKDVANLFDDVVVSTDDVLQTGATTSDWSVFKDLPAKSSVYLTAGTHYFRIKASNDKTWQWNLDKITFKKLMPTISFDTKSEVFIRVTPNPFNDFIQINNPQTIMMVEVGSINGRVLKKVVVNNSSTTINTSELTSGLYILSVYNLDGTRTTHKIVKF